MTNLFRYILSLMLIAAAFPAWSQITTEPVDPQTETGDVQPGPGGNRPDRKGWKWDNFYVGGVPGFGISNYYMEVSVAAEAGYFVHERVSVGLRNSYTYSRDRYYEVSYNIIRTGPFVRGYVWEGIFAQAEYELTYLKNFKDRSQTPVITYPTYTNNSLLLGAGYHDNYENGFGFYFAVLAHVVNSNAALASNPTFQLGLTYRFHGKE